MSAPTIISVTPTADETDVILGTQIIVIFSALMDHSTINAGTFSLTGPGQTMVVTPDQTVTEDPEPITGREYITGIFDFDDTIGSGTQTKVTFNPSKPLRPDSEYTVLIMGSGGVLTSDAIKDASHVAMAASYTWLFTTGELNLSAPPPQSPVPGATAQLDPATIVIIPRQSGNHVTGADLTQVIDLIFPDSVSLIPYDPTPDILTSVEAMLGDPDVVVPTGLTVTPSWLSYGGKPNRKLSISITGWPS